MVKKIGTNTLLTVIGLQLILLEVNSQNMNNPYSVYGIGDIDHKSYNRTSGMASTGLALRSSSYIINNNPASITGLERSFVVMNLAATAKTSTYVGKPIGSDNSNNKDMWVKGISLGVKLNNHWASNIGFGQFSSVNYKFSGSQAVEGSTDVYTTSYEGDGGLNEYYWVNALSIGKHFSVGVRSSFISGAINATETIYDANLQTEITTQQQDYYNNFRFQYGALYYASLGKKWDLSMGGRYSRKTKLALDRALTVTQDGTAVVEDQFVSKGRFWLPETFAAGIALAHNKRTTFAMDYTYEDWSSLGVKYNGWRLINSHKLSGGVEFSKFIQQWNQPVEKKFYQLGAFVQNSYLQVRSNPIREFGFTAGMGGRLGNNLLYTFSGEFGQRGTTNANLVKENYFQFTLSLSYRDFLFSKGRRYN